MKQIYLLLITLACTSLGFGQIVSQYVETESGTAPKGIEIWNNTAGTLDFATNNLIIQQGTNGGAATDIPGTLISTGTLAPNDVIVIGTSGTLQTVTESNGSQFIAFNFVFNGNDALVVKYGGVTTDVFGTPGSDPGTAWAGGGVSTANENIALNTGITSGSTGFTDPSTRFSTISTTPFASGAAGLTGFGIAPAPSCTSPSTQASNYSTSTLAPTSATLNWTRGDGDNVLVVLKQGSAVDTDPTSGTTYTADAAFGAGQQIGTGNYVVYNGSGTSVNITGLTAGTDYYVAVYEYATTETCYNTTELTGNYTTLCSTYAIPFNEGFESGVPPICWTQFSGTNGLGTLQQWQTTATSHTGAGAASVEWEDVTGGLAEDWLVTPAIDLTGSTNNTLTFWTKDGFTTDFGSLYSVKVSTTSQTDRASFVDVATYNEVELGNNYNQKTVDLSAYSGNIVYIAFVLTNDDGDFWFVDDVSIVDSSVCTPPSQATTFNATSIDGGAGTTTLNWVRGDGDNVLVVMKADSAVNTDPSIGTSYTASSAFGSGDELGTGNFVVYNGPATSMNVSNLIANTTYHVAIYEYGVSGTCYNTTPLTGNFLVPCPTYGLPFEEGFEGASFPPSCWTSFRGANGFGVFQDWQLTIDANTGSQAAFVDWEDDINGATEDWLVTPAINLSGILNSTLTFFSKDGDDSEDYGSSYTIRVSTTSQTDYGSFSIVETYTETDISGNYLQQTVDLTAYDGQTIYLAFVLAQDFGDSWFLDDVKVEGTIIGDDDTEIYASAFPVPATTIVAANTTTVGASENAFAFTVEDLGTNDGLPTNITTMRFVPGANNTADWTDAIQGLTLVDENVISYVPTTTTINDTEIILEFSPAIVVPNNTALDFTLGLYLNTTPVVDNSVVQFQIEDTSSGFVADASGSGFAEPFTLGTITGNNITIDVQATEIGYSKQPTNTSVNLVMAPAVTMSGVDVNQNLDTDYNQNITITSTGTLYNSPVTETASSGIATFSLIHTAAGTGFVLTASDGTFADVDSDTFDVSPIVSIAIEDFDDTTPHWNNDIANLVFVDPGSPDQGLFIQPASSNNPNFSGNTAFGQDLEGEAGEPTLPTPYKLTFDDVIVAGGYTSLQLSFDYHVFSNGDIGYYEVYYDGVGQGLVEYYNNPDVPPGISGTITVPLPSNIISVGLELTGTLDGTSDTIEWDNFQLTGVASLPSDYIYNNAWTPEDPSGVSTLFDNISVIAGSTSITTATYCNNITIDAGTELTIEPQAALMSFGNINNNGTLSMESTSISYSTLMTDNEVSGSGIFTYNRHVNIGGEPGSTTGNNDLISAPVSGESFGSFAAANTNIVTDPINSNRKLFGPFDKATGEYLTYDTVLNASTILDAGEGYRAASTDNGGFTFTGTVNVGPISKNIVYSAGVDYPEWNLIGNPYTSYLNVYDFLNYEVAPGVRNIDLMLLTSAALYGYDGQASDGWITYNLLTADPNTLITPGQAFFVSADPLKVAAYDMQFAPTMRNSGTNDDFISGRNVAPANLHLVLQATKGSQKYKTDFYFTDDSTLGLDHGYDAAVFGDGAPTFSIYSHLVQDNNGMDMAIQALNRNVIGSDIVIPLGLNIGQGQQATISIIESNLPENVEVYLEDNVAGSFTLLNNSDYTFTAATTLSDTGRFFLRFTDNTLNTPEFESNALQIFSSSSPRTVHIKGLLDSETTVSMYDLQGRLVITSKLKAATNSNKIDVTSLSDGVYVVKLNNRTQQKTQKVIIK